ncbi:hypothetical protein DPMN_022930 [Dreissena polymorpha]|uniref:Uncharacterized protein n=1 Tax=Dreissena polymorpha TaxID=45954 RepID=A0A9D4LM34_DREPO|nr:hypothetical protein DPMN_022930 [Dreissena polymorpha]
MTNGRRRGELSTSRSYSTGQLLRTHRRFCQLYAICQSSAAFPQRNRSAAPSSNLRTENLQNMTAYLQNRLRLIWRLVWSYYTQSSATYGKKEF